MGYYPLGQVVVQIDPERMKPETQEVHEVGSREQVEQGEPQGRH